MDQDLAMEEVDVPYPGDPGDFFPDESEVNHFNRMSCVKGTTESLQGMLITVCAMAAMQRMLMMTILPLWLKNLLMIAAGVYAIGDVVNSEESVALLLGPAIGIVVMIRLLGKWFQWTTFFVTVTCTGLIYYFAYHHEDGTCRGIMMLLAMKLITLSSNYQERLQSFNFLTSLAYLFNPATVIFGPYISYEEFEETLELKRKVKHELQTWFASALCVVFSVGFVVFSSCSSIGLTNQHWLIVDYQTALNFRFSHYFICILSQGSYWLIGGELWVVKPDVMEMPRSLVNVVTAWNVPMHKFLHRYIYNPAKNAFPIAMAFVATFIVSAALHGFNFQLSAVLVTLGFYCYFENKLRNRLSTRLDCCVRARSCFACNHRYKYSDRLATLINVFFALLAVYELIYLGMPFDGVADNHELGYQMSHTLEIWKSHHYAGHWLIVVGWIASLIV